MDNSGALAWFEKAFLLGEGIDQSIKNLNRNSIAENRLVLGQLYTTMGRFRESMTMISGSLDLFRQTGNRRGEMEALLAMGSVCLNTGDMEFARTITENSAAIADELDVSTARHLNNLARISASLGEYQDAIRYQENALNLANRYDIAAQEIWYTLRLGDLYRDLGDLWKRLITIAAQSMRITLIEGALGIDASIDSRFMI
ncbi:MAG: tetratricopeptide repeat protein [Bacteroidales bacterium]